MKVIALTTAILLSVIVTDAQIKIYPTDSVKSAIVIRGVEGDTVMREYKSIGVVVCNLKYQPYQAVIPSVKVQTFVYVKRNEFDYFPVPIEAKKPEYQNLKGGSIIFAPNMECVFVQGEFIEPSKN